MQTLNKRNVAIFKLVLLMFLMISCHNQYENRLVGEYLNTKCIDSEVDNLPFELNLKLIDNNRFSITSSGLMKNGTWKADDDGDRTWIRLYFDSKVVNGIVLGSNFDILEFNNPEIIDSRLICLKFSRKNSK